MQVGNTYSILAVFLLAGVHVLSAAPQIKLPPRKDRVIPVHTRVVVLDAAESYLLHAGGEPTAVPDAEISLFSFEGPKKAPEVQRPQVNDAVVAPEITYNYDNLSVLKLVAVSLSKQVTGTLARGEKRYLQLQGGKLLSPGAVFPARLPELKDEVFRVAIESINSDGYYLKLGEASLFVPFEPKSDGASSFSNQN